MTYQWVDYDPNFIAQRYDRLADIIPFFDWLFFIPAGLRKHAVRRLSLEQGDCVLDAGVRSRPMISALYGADRVGRRLVLGSFWGVILIRRSDSRGIPESLAK